MSDPISALKNVSETVGTTTITEIGPVGMMTLRGDLADKALGKAVVAAGGVNLPDPRHCNVEGQSGIAWMSPDELLVICPYDQVHDRLGTLQGKIAGQHALAVNVSDARAVFDVTGPNVREIVAKLAPVDMHPKAFSGTAFRRTRFGQVPAAFWMPAADTVRIVCFRSVAQYMFDQLKDAAMVGSEVGHYAALPQ